MSGSALHITNGDVAADGIRQATGEEVLPWRDVLHDGPVPLLDDAALRDVRAAFIASRGWAREQEVRADLEARDALVQSAAGVRPIILWFEPDLYDQLQLLQVLERLARTSGRLESDIALVAPAIHFGGLTTAQLAGLLSSRAPVSAAQLELGRQGWDAFRAPSPEPLEALARLRDPPLAFLPGAVRRHLEEYPALTNGLARSESKVLQTAVDGAIALRAAFQDVQRAEEWSYLGDTSFLEIVRELARGPHPLVRPSPPLEEALARGWPIDRDRWEDTFALTEEGRSVLAGRTDRIGLRGIDRWLGGVHLQGDRIWRWDGERLTQPT